jgi:hypothetical protein
MLLNIHYVWLVNCVVTTQSADVHMLWTKLASRGDSASFTTFHMDCYRIYDGWFRTSDTHKWLVTLPLTEYENVISNGSLMGPLFTNT